MTDTERRTAAKQFIEKWTGRGREDEDDRSYWIDILDRIIGIDNVTDHIEFQKKVIVNGNTKRIDAYIPETKVLIEQKSLDIALDKKVHQSGGIDAEVFRLQIPETSACIREQVNSLDERGRYIMECLNKGMTAKKIGEELGVTQTAVRQKAHTHAYNILRHIRNKQ